MFNDKKIPLKYKIYTISFLLLWGILLYGIKYIGNYPISSSENYSSEELVLFLTTSYKNYYNTDSEDIKFIIRNEVKKQYPDLDTTSMSNENIRSFYILCISE